MIASFEHTRAAIELEARNRERRREWELRRLDYLNGFWRPEWNDWRRQEDRLAYMIGQRRRVRPAFRFRPGPPEAA